MTITKQIIDLNQMTDDAKNLKPTLTSWKGARMVRVHSILATVTEILNMLNSLDVIKIGIIGEPSTGKTTLAMVLYHLIHSMSKIQFAVRVMGEEQFLDIEKTLSELEATNYILYFHDLSFLQDKKRLEEVKAAITKIRHLKSDVKIILIYDYHYTLGLDKYLRQANFRFFTSIGSSEFDNMVKILGTKYTPVVFDFNKKYVEMTSRQTCTFSIRGKPFHVYNYKNPFVVCVFFNNVRPRYVIFPKREWIEEVCSICSNATGILASSIPVDKFIEETEKMWGKGTFESALKLHAFVNGINTYSPKTVQMQRYLNRAFLKKEIALEELLTAKGLTITKTVLRKKLDGILAA